jgi:glycosyltransferase involved in cell wall biosynthesis
VLKMMRKCTALIFPSIWYEGMPITIIEAYSCGTAVIASNLGAMSAMIIDGKTGLLFDANNYTSLTHAINKWTNLKVYDRESMYQNAMNEYNLKYSSESNINELITVYSKIIN